MHVHVYNEIVRTTIEIKPEHRARVLELAASRGEKGFSAVVADALEFYLRAQRARSRAIHKALALKGSIGEKEAARLRADTRSIRAHWR
jgi:hypothetical protein